MIQSQKMHSILGGKYSSLFGELKHWRENFPYKVNNYKGILPFVVGLRFSVRVMYILKEIFRNSNLDAAWGHILKMDNSYGIYYSNECDIIIHKKIATSVPHVWNGNKIDKAMDFKFVRKDSVLGVISCKSNICKSQIDPDYPTQLKVYTKNVWLFAECCGHNSYDIIKKEAIKLGYKDFWCLYKWSPKKGAKENYDSWAHFDHYFEKFAKDFS